MPTTELELQEIFDELDNISDYSGPEILDEPDRTSIGMCCKMLICPNF